MAKIIAFIVIGIFFFTACEPKLENDPLFELLPSDFTGIDFVNEVTNTEKFNIFSYRNFYNGGGVGLGDINNDGLSDIFLTSNMGSNKLYLNKGDMQFEDITNKANVSDSSKWSTGVVFIDINSDGLKDLYVCNAGYRPGSDQKNSLYINNGDLTFREAAGDYGLDDSGYTTHAAFFDYDKDGDLDVYMLNNSFIPVNTLNYSNKRDLRAQDWPVKDFLKGGGDKFYRNDDGKFVDISEDAGIYGSLIGFGLGVNVADLNGDGWIDIYVCNDFFERDYYYINDREGGFDEALEEHFPHISLSSMGADIGDVNNDGLLDIFVTDMLPDDHYRLKTTATFENTDVYNLKKSRGFYHQYMQNGLHVNAGDGNFQDVAHFAGVSASDWSWGALMFDADGDMNNDLFISNGIFHDVTNQDFIDFFANDVIQKMTLSGKKEEVDNIISEMPSEPIPNKFFKNLGDGTYVDFAKDWGVGTPSFSNGAAYGDLDNDGDLDLVVNNLNQETSIFKNNSSNNYVKVKLKGKGQNRDAIGAMVKCFIGDTILTRIHNPTRGFQSSIDYNIVFGVGEHFIIDSLFVYWPDDKISRMQGVTANQELMIEHESANKTHFTPIGQGKKYFQSVNHSMHAHQEDDFNDFYYERNLSQITSKEGPGIAVGDVNNDGFDDVFITGAAQQASQLYIGTTSGLQEFKQEIFEMDKNFEDVVAEFIDVDNDGDLDLYIGTGGNNHPVFSTNLNDRLYINDGKGNFERDLLALPKTGMNTSVIAPYDFDQDGDIDLFVGSRSIPGSYGISPANYFLQNTGGKFKEISKSLNPELFQVGLVTDAKWINVVGGKQKELVIVGEWMEPKIFKYTGVAFERVKTNLDELKGWWFHVNHTDIDKDGDEDLILGNKGKNFYLRPSGEKELRLWLGDFTGSGNYETVLTQKMDGKDYPVASLRDLTDQFSFLKKQNIRHSEFATKTIQDLFGKEVMDKLSAKTINFNASIIAINNGDGHFTIEELPQKVQYSSVNASLTLDVNNDGFEDLLIGGNNYGYLPQFSRLDASYGALLLNDGKSNYQYISGNKSGFFTKGEVKAIKKVNESIIVGINDNSPQIFKQSDVKNEL